MGRNELRRDDAVSAQRAWPNEPASWPGLAGRAAIVTGGSRNMGRAFALGLADAGSDVAILDLPGQEPAARAVVAEIGRRGGRATFVPVDIGDRDAVTAAVDAAERALGTIRILINNAARTDDDEAALLDYPVASLDAQYDITLRGTFLMTQAVGRRLVAEAVTGSVVNVASRVGQQVQSGSLGYSIAKAAVIHMTRLMALDLAPRGIRVNAIGPGPVPRPDRPPGGPDARRFPLGRQLTYDDMVGTALYLASDAAAMVTGQCVIIDGGLGLAPAY